MAREWSIRELSEAWGSPPETVRYQLRAVGAAPRIIGRVWLVSDADRRKAEAWRKGHARK